MLNTFTIDISQYPHIDIPAVREIVQILNTGYVSFGFLTLKGSPVFTMQDNIENNEVKIYVHPAMEREEYTKLTTTLHTYIVAYNKGYDRGDTQGYKTGYIQAVKDSIKSLTELIGESRNG